MDRTAHLRKRLNDVAETSSLRERCALGADDDDETFGGEFCLLPERYRLEPSGENRAHFLGLLG